MPHAVESSVKPTQAPLASSNGTPPVTKPSQPRQQRPKKPNYNYIHRYQLPIQIQPLPPLIPHNPLSVLAVALSYVAQLLNPPSQAIYDGYFSSATSSIQITDEKMIRALWEMGFFGKGSLSRSEPAWMSREKKRGETSEEATEKRRNERKEFKMERARKEQIEIAEKLRAEQAQNGIASNSALRINTADMAEIGSILSKSNDEIKEEATQALEQSQQIEALKDKLQSGMMTPPSTSSSANATPVNGTPNGTPGDRLVAKRQVSNGAKSVRFSPTIEAREFDLSSPVMSPLKQPGPSPLAEQVAIPKTELEDQEHLELSLEEAFFLVYGLGILRIFCDDGNDVMDPVSLLSIFRRHSYFPPQPLAIPPQPDDPFMISYSVYHHFRSLGWVVRSGVKFSVDYLLYNRGPVFSHAEFAVIIIPAYTDPYWSESNALREAVKEKTARSWSWLHGVNRVQSQVRKSLVLCYVDIPPPLDEGAKPVVEDIGATLKRYRVREVNVRRWTPNRSRD